VPPITLRAGKGFASATSTKPAPVSSSPCAPAATQSHQAPPHAPSTAIKDDFIYSHELLPLDSTGTSTCQSRICFGREGTAPTEAAVAGSNGCAAASAVLPTKERAVSLRHLKFDDLSRHRIEEHYENSHPKQWASNNRAVSQRGRSSKTIDSVFRAERITGHFSRRDRLGEDKGVSKAVRGNSAKLFSRGTRCSGPRSYLCDRRVETGRPTRGV
jgi:hypothetical protein